MREVAKSMLGFSWAVSLFGAQQIAAMVAPSPESRDAAAATFDEASRAMQAFLSETVSQQFQRGDEWQRRVVDAVFDAAQLGNIDAGRLVQTGVDAARQSFGAVKSAAARTSSTA